MTFLLRRRRVLHATDESAPDKTRQASAEAGRAGLTFVPRSRAGILPRTGRSPISSGATWARWPRST
jgi:hypothetical protein